MTSRSEPLDVAVIGAGPAGLAAACGAADAGLAVAVLDLGERIGGQYYRHTAEQAISGRSSPYHHGWDQFKRLRTRFESHVPAGRIVYLPRHSVWSISRQRRDRQVRTGNFVVRATEGERERLARNLQARSVVIATGAYDRQIPFPGWTLPGVMAGGSAQALLKGSSVAPGTRAVVAGTGPFLLAVADGLLTAKVGVAAVVEANAPWALARHPAALPGLATKLGEATAYARALARDRVPYRIREAVVAAAGRDDLEAVTIARVDDDWNIVAGSERQVACDLLTVGYGFTAQIDLAVALGCAYALGDDRSLVVSADSGGRTSEPGVYAAGETTGVGGADLAVVEGRLCGAAIAADLDRREVLGTGERTRLLLRRRLLREFATAMHRAHPVRNGWTRWLDTDTHICRCEEVTHARVLSALEQLGAEDARAVKLLARPGMGWCQGRICGYPVAELTAVHHGRDLSAVDLVAMSKRTLASPVPIGQLAALDDIAGPRGPAAEQD